MVNNYKYDEWGNILESNETISNPFKYAGEVYDEETGLYYLRARYYDPALGRFTNEDAVEGQVNNPLSMNLYTYCYTNPLLYTDPTGNTPKDYFAGLANALDDNITSGALRWVLGKMLKVNQSYQYDNAVDYYAGRVTGDILSMIGGSSSIVVEGVIGGTAQFTYGGIILSASAKNFGNDLNKLREASNKGAGKTDILSGKTLTNQTGKVNNYVSRTKGNAAAQADFNAMKPSNVRTYSNGTVVGDLPDGRTINLHPSTSLGGTSTVEIYNPNTGISTKIRY